MKMKHDRGACAPTTSVPATPVRQQPQELAPTQSANGGSGSKAQTGDRSGTESRNAAKPASSAVKPAPTSSAYSPGPPASLRDTVPTPPTHASATAVTATAPIQTSARTHGERSRRTGRSSPASDRISASAPSRSDIAAQPLPQRLQRPMQVDLERDLRAPS